MNKETMIPRGDYGLEGFLLNEVVYYEEMLEEALKKAKKQRERENNG